MASSSYGSSSANNYVFDIFINHRGPDTKKTLAKRLCDLLSKHGLRVFLDEDVLQAGEDVTPQIDSAIRTASVHIAIFSRGYADSTWCLKELLLMFESGSTIIPVFYGVEPANLRWGTGVIGLSLQSKGSHYDYNTIKKWRKALFDASERKGFDMKTYNDDEQQLLEQVVEAVLKNVKRPLNVSRYPTGLDEIVAEFEGAMLLDQQSRRETRVIGIVGLGGAGKTTLAKEIFNRLRSNYKQTYFQSDVRENVARSSLESIQSMIVSRLAQVNLVVQIDNTADGIEKLQRYLRSSHAFLILDDVENFQQVEALLLPVKDVVQQGSLILATTRNKDVLTSAGIAESSIFKLRGLDKDYSRKLFCRHAFNQPYPPREFEQVARAFADSCAGLPLSLKVFGSHLRGKKLKYWNAQLNDISRLHKDIMVTLKISYDSLDKIEKEIFLDIVCFFIGEDKDTAIRVWDGAGWGGWLRLQNLENRCLVEVDDKNCIRMHAHVRDMGRYIAETEPPGETLRLSCPTHDNLRLSHKSQVRGISTVHSQGCERAQTLFANLKEFAGNCFTNYVRGLQLIRTEGCFEESEFIESIIRGAMSLIWLCWVNFPFSSLPSWIPLGNLRVLRIESRRGLSQALWLHGSQAPEQLRELYVHATRVEVPKSIGKLSHLEKIVVSFSKRGTLPDELCHLQSLKHFELSQKGSLSEFEFVGCSSSNMLPDSFENLKNLRTIKLSSCSRLRVLPDSFGKLTNLQTIDLSRCSSLQVLPDSFGNLTNLQTIDLSACYRLQVLPDSFGNLTNLQTINLSDCSSLQEIPDSFENLKNLQTIDLTACYSLQVLPDSFGNLTNLQTIDLSLCRSLQVLPDSFGNLTNLQTIDLFSCCILQELPNSFGNLKNLRTIDLSKCSSMLMLPHSFGDSTNLQTINLSGCSSLRVLPDSFGNLTNLQTIDLSGCFSLQVLPDSFGNLIQLEGLQFDSLTVSQEVYGKMHTFKCSGVIDFNRVEVLPVR